MGNKKQINNKILEISSMAFAVVFVFLLLSGSAWAEEISPENVIRLVNRERKLNHLDELKINCRLEKAAEDKVDNMIDRGYFSHNSPNGITPWHWFDIEGYNYRFAGENLAINYETAEGQHRAWMESDSHRKNILDPKYKEIGVAIGQGVIEGNYSSVTVQLFGTKDILNSDDNSALSHEQDSANNNLCEKESKESIVLGVSKSNETKTFIRQVNQVDKELVFSSKKKNIEDNFMNNLSWLAFILSLMIIVGFNFIYVFRGHHHNPFSATNSLVLFLALSVAVMTKF